MKQSNYPDISFQSCFDIHSIGVATKKNPSYIKDSPYSDPIKKILLSFFEKPEPKAANAEVPLNLEELDLEREINLLYLSTKELLVADNLDSKEKIAVQKTATSQLEKLLDMATQAKNLKQMREFEEKVIRALKVVSPELRDDFLKELTGE